MTRSRFLFLGVLAGFAVAAVGARAEEPFMIREAWAAIPGQLFPILMMEKNVLRHYGKSYVVDAIRMPGSGPQTTALASGELQFALFAPAAFALAVQNAHMTDLRVIGEATRDGYKDYYSRQFAVLPDSPIHAVADLKGKVIGDNSIGGAMDMGFRNYALEHGMVDKRDYSVVEVEFPNMLAALEAKRIDLGFFTTPFSVNALKEKKIRVLFTMRDAMGGETELTIIAARKPFLEAHRAALVDYFEDTQRAMRWTLDPANRDAVIALISSFTKRPASAYSEWIFTKGDDYHDPDARPNLDAMQKNLDVMRKLGLLKIHLDVKAYADLSLIDEAAARLH
jgi:ABC-type nitrate/sulfonate/bicarbonate transport system substrate-binding protein